MENMIEKEMNWNEFGIKTEFEDKYVFHFGFNIISLQDDNKLICFNRNNSLETTGTNHYFRIDEININSKRTKTLYSKADGPRYRLTNIVLDPFGSKFYFYGGTVAINRDVNLYSQDLWIFNLNVGNFESIKYNHRKVSDSPGCRGSHSFVYDSEKNKIFLFAGKNETDRFNDLFEYDINSETFMRVESITSPPIARSNHTATIFKRSMIIFGGWDGTKTLNDMYEFSLNTYIWYNINYKSELIPPPVYRHAAVVIGDSLLIFGGVNEFNQKFNELYILNFLEKKWSILFASGKYPSPRTFHNLAYFNNKIFLFGGFNNHVLNDVYSLVLNEIYLKCIDHQNSNSNNPGKDLHNEEFSNNDLNLLKNQVTELKQKYENEIFKNNCKICFEKEINTVILDCGHRYICYDCSFNCSSKCPACKGEIKNILKTYN